MIFDFIDYDQLANEIFETDFDHRIPMPAVCLPVEVKRLIQKFEGRNSQVIYI